MMEGLSADVGDFWVGASVKVLDNPSSLDFLRECVATYQPAIIRGLIHDWPAMREWNLSKVCEKLENGTPPTEHGKRLLKVNVTPDGHGDCLKGNGKDQPKASSTNTSEQEIELVFVYPAECLMSTALFHEMMTAPLEDDAVPYLSLQNDNLRLEMCELMVDISDSIQIAEDAFGQSQPEAGYPLF
jgi:Cupin-like domain